MINGKLFAGDPAIVGPVNRDNKGKLHSVNPARSELIDVLSRVAELRDTESGNHIVRIGLYSSILAKAMDLPSTFIDAVSIGGALHDIGNVGIPDSILFNDGQLSAADFEIMKLHTIIGGRILGGTQDSTMFISASIASTHHEKWDGSGYPNGLRKENIPIEGRIVMLADCYDTLRSKQTYNGRINHLTACKAIIEGDAQSSPEHFDPRVIDAFLKVTSAFAEIFESRAVNSSADDTFGKVKNLLKWYTCNM